MYDARGSRAIVALLVLAGCAERGVREARVEPALTATASDEPSAMVVGASASPASPPPAASTSAPPASSTAPPNPPPAPSPSFATVAQLAAAVPAEGEWFFDARFAAASPPCGACPPVPPCVAGRPCLPPPACSPCPTPFVTFSEGGKFVNVFTPTSPGTIAPQKMVRVVARASRGGMWFVRLAEACPPSECFETEPPTRLAPPLPGSVLRRDGPRCFAEVPCPPQTKCDKLGEMRVRCPS